MNPKLKEAAVHGSKEYPVAIYDLQNIGSSFHVSLHWHEELEIVYVYEGPLYLTIENTDYIGRQGDIFIVNPKEIHKIRNKPFPIGFTVASAHLTVELNRGFFLFESVGNILVVVVSLAAAVGAVMMILPGLSGAPGQVDPGVGADVTVMQICLQRVHAEAHGGGNAGCL